MQKKVDQKRATLDVSNIPLAHPLLYSVSHTTRTFPTSIQNSSNILQWGTPLSSLPLIDWDTYTTRAQNGESLISIAGVIHDVSSFIKDHPGGKALICSAIGKDATAMFNGGVYMHTNAAHNLLSTMRVGMLRGGVEVEAWKRKAGKVEMVGSYGEGVEMGG